MNRPSCSVCGACGCNTKLTFVNGQYYCNAHVPATTSTIPTKKDDQVLTIGQQFNASQSKR